MNQNGDRLPELKLFLRGYVVTALHHAPTLTLAQLSQALREVGAETANKTKEEYLEELNGLGHFPSSMLE